MNRYGWRVYAVTLMPNHFHLFFRTHNPTSHEVLSTYWGITPVRLIGDTVVAVISSRDVSAAK